MEEGPRAERLGECVHGQPGYAEVSRRSIRGSEDRARGNRIRQVIAPSLADTASYEALVGLEPSICPRLTRPPLADWPNSQSGSHTRRFLPRSSSARRTA